MTTPICQVQRLGLIDYQQAWEMQDRFAVEVAQGQRPATLMLLEHPHTYTFGRSGRGENMLWDEIELARKGIKVYWVDRGGDVTYHGPGQLVGYPILPLAPGGLLATTGSAPRMPQADYIGYLRNLEKMLVAALARMGVDAIQVPGLTGVWVSNPATTGKLNPSQAPPAKIAAIGVKVDARGVSHHGFALNVNPNMDYWDGIIACGLVDHPVISLASLLDQAPSMEQMMEAVEGAFGRIFGYIMRRE